MKLEQGTPKGMLKSCFSRSNASDENGNKRKRFFAREKPAISNESDIGKFDCDCTLKLTFLRIIFGGAGDEFPYFWKNCLAKLAKVTIVSLADLARVPGTRRVHLIKIDKNTFEVNRVHSLIWKIN